MINESMFKANSDTILLPKVDLETFGRLSSFAYVRDYTLPKPSVDNNLAKKAVAKIVQERPFVEKQHNMSPLSSKRHPRSKELDFETDRHDHGHEQRNTSEPGLHNAWKRPCER